MIVTLPQIITDVQMTNTVAEFFDKLQNAPATFGADVGMTGIQCQFEIRETLQDVNKIARLDDALDAAAQSIEAAGLSVRRHPRHFDAPLDEVVDTVAAASAFSARSRPSIASAVDTWVPFSRAKPSFDINGRGGRPVISRYSAPVICSPW